ncbi:large ribosomal subunit protein uL29m [Panulirus ornatus]|uniref:large ribosomal subunit protein uL29m n=1 Tax=Panulirus ornatus TaxID=150431 RepID=UPI003A867369
MMAGVRRASTLVNVLSKFNRLTITSGHTISPALRGVTTNNYFRTLLSSASLHTSGSRRGLSEFFDDEKNWGEQVVKVGRAWKVDEIRIKSNDDLHKLWYVLLKEKNMLLTMEHACKEECRLFPNPERIDKVEESMKNIETVVQERNRAYWMLETGEAGGRPGGMVRDALGSRKYKRFTEHFIPVWMHRQSKEAIHRGMAVGKFQRHLKEQKFLEKRKYYRRINNHVRMLMRRYPNMNLEALQEQYPECNIEALRRTKYARGNHSQNKG